MAEFLKELRSITADENIKLNEPMKNHTSFKLGGPADILVTPGNIAELQEIVRSCRKSGLPVMVMGNGTNLIVRDKGIRGIVIKINDKLANFTVTGETIEAEAGILLSKLSNIALQNELTGLEFASGIPGTLGGAVAMNAGAYDGQMKNVVVETQYIDNNCEIKVLKGEEHKFGNRTSFIQEEGGVVLKSKVQLVRGKRDEIKARMDELAYLRRTKQPLHLPSAGSIFKRPEGHFAGKLIEDAGLMGYKIGGAEVSTLHAGFIVNTNNASAQDVTDLIKYIQGVISEKFGVKLQTEVKIIGEE